MGWSGIALRPGTPASKQTKKKLLLWNRHEPERFLAENEQPLVMIIESERINNLNWRTSGRCEVKDFTGEYIFCLEEPEFVGDVLWTL